MNYDEFKAQDILNKTRTTEVDIELHERLKNKIILFRNNIKKTIYYV